jgi:serine/threonine protein kinase/tetratricopeptide (TPR) repeat protein
MAETRQVQDGNSAGEFPAMIRVIRICRNCGAKILSDAPEGLCTGCVLEAAIGVSADVIAGVGDPGRVADVRGETANGAPKNKKSARAAELLGELGDYELLEEIGRGGQGVVFRARQKSLNRTVALKIVRLGQWASKAHLKRFRLEAEAAARLEHPGIVPIHEVGEGDGSCYFSMKFIEGGQLDEVVRRAPLSIRQAAELMARVARTVHYAHEHGILHRDIKPGNILLDAKGEPHLTDFGLARLVESESSVTQTLDVLGTPSYMAPEQAVGKNAAVSSATDVYGLGAVLYQLLTGHPPFAGGTTYETIKLLESTEPRPPRLLNPTVDRDLSRVCLKCLEKDPKRRYSSALALAEDLERWLKHEPIEARHTGIFARGKKWVRRNPSIAVMAAMLLTLAVPLGVMVWKSEFPRQPLTTGIAVLPFENLNDEKGHPAFADGVQDDILTKLAKIADLKVISRTSVMEYRGKRNVQEIGDALRVSHVLEGSARRSGDRIHLNAQLIDTRTDTHVWAEEYDRDLNDLFAIQSEIAQEVAARLNAKVTAAEKLAIERKPTTDLVANALYVQAMEVELKEGGPQSTWEPVRLLNEAVARDPHFVLAYCELGRMHLDIFHWYDHTPARLELANAAIQNAVRLQPDAGEVHRALAMYAYWGFFDYDRVRAELELARRKLPNDANIYWMTALVDRRQGRWTEAIRNFDRAVELDPRNPGFLLEAARNYSVLRRYSESSELWGRIVAIAPHKWSPPVRRAEQPFLARADVRPLRKALSALLAEHPEAANDSDFAGVFFLCAMAERDSSAVSRALECMPADGLMAGNSILWPREFFAGVAARAFNDTAAAHTSFTAARAIAQKIARDKPDNGYAWSLLGLIDASLGRKEEAVREGRRACELVPMSKDTILGVDLITNLANIYAWTGENDLALEQLAVSAQAPFGVHYGELKLDPVWDRLRGDPRFEKIVASLAPKGN